MQRFFRSYKTYWVASHFSRVVYGATLSYYRLKALADGFFIAFFAHQQCASELFGRHGWVLNFVGRRTSIKKHSGRMQKFE
jgi:hypothetical protein